MRFFLLWLLLFSSLLSSQKALEKVSLQLLWLDQFQFAGYYMAIEKGFYADEGLEVQLKPFEYSLDVADEVIAKRSNYGIGRSSLIRLYSENKDIILLSAIFQSSPMVLISLKSSGIESMKEFEGKSLMLTKDAVETASIHAMLTSAKLDENKMAYVEHDFNLSNLIEGSVDLYAGYVSNEPYILEKKGTGVNIFDPKNHGFDFYSDILFTSKEEAENNPKRTERFRNASLKGWHYAFDNMQESVDVIYKKYNFQNKSKEALMFEAKELKKLALRGSVKLGNIDLPRLYRIFDVYKIMGLTGERKELSEILFKDTFFTKEERAYLRDKKEIKICVLPNSRPYSAIEDGKFIGIGAEILELTKNKIEIPYTLVETSTWMESLAKGKNKECDLLPIASKTATREYFFSFTEPYHSEPLVIVTDKKQHYILDFETVLDREFSIVSGHSFIEELKHKYPSIKLKVVQSTQEGLSGVQEGKYYGHIDVLIAIAYSMQQQQGNKLQISGQLDKKIEVSFAVRKDDKILLKIFEKLASELKPHDLQKLLNDWVSINYKQNINFIYLYESIILMFLAVIIIFMRHRTLKRKNYELNSLQNELMKVNFELETRVSEATYDLEKAQEVAKIGSWTFDNSNASLKWSKETYKIFDIDVKSENLYETFLQRIHPEDRDKAENAYLESIDNKTGYSVKYRILMDDDSVRYILETCETSFDEKGNSLISHGAAQDITADTLAKIEIKKKDAFMLHQSRLAQMGEMLSMIAHQWKQPLSAISIIGISLKTVLELEKYDLKDDKQREEFLDYLNLKLDKIATYVQNLSHTITNFSDFYKPNKKASRLSLSETIVKAYTLVDDSFASAKIEVEFDLEANNEVMMHENEFMQVLLNILNNAREQLLQNSVLKPEIKVHSFSKDDSVYIQISDNAGGIKESLLSDIFNPYFSTKLEKNGTGLGLYMSKVIINDYHNGDIYAKNSENGAIFTIKLEKLNKE